MKLPTNNFAKILYLVLLGALLISCEQQERASQDLYAAVDQLYKAIVSNTNDYQIIAEIDHSRLAAKEGEVMPPARVVIFSDPEINTLLLQQEPLTGLDLPFRALAYAAGDEPAVIVTTADYLKRRHGLEEGPALQKYENGMVNVIDSLPNGSTVEFDTVLLNKDEGIVVLNSEFEFEQTIDRLKASIMSEAGTVWFGEIDYQAEAEAIGTTLPKLTLLLFGAPGPGAKAMADIPRMGLDAFCQKVLVYELADGQVNVYFNEMPVFAELHQGTIKLPHRVINYRMGKTLGDAVVD